ncbi:hypothetical protein D3C72_1081520 [compost metagenome]
MVHEEGVRKDHTPIRGCIIDDLHIQLLADILGKIRLVLLHVGKPQALIGIRKAYVGESAIAISGNCLPGVGIYDIYIGQLRVFRSAKLEANPAAAPQLESAGAKYAGCCFVILPTVQMIGTFLVVRYILRPPSRFVGYTVWTERIAFNNAPSGQISGFKSGILNLIDRIRTGDSLDIL